MNVDDMAAIAYLLRHHNNILAITVPWLPSNSQASRIPVFWQKDPGHDRRE